MRRRRVFLAAIPLAAVAAFACDRGTNDRLATNSGATTTNQTATFADQAKFGVAAAPPPAPTSAGLMRAERPSVSEAASSFGASAGGVRGDASALDPSRAGPTDVGDPTQRGAPDMVIRTGQASVEVDSLDLAIARVRQLASRVGGVIANSTLQSGRDQVRAATLEIRVQAQRFDELVAGLTPFGKVETVNVTAEDVGEEYVDLSARVTNARRLEQRLIELLATRTGKLSDVLTVERELARVREEIERYEGRLRYLRARSAVSTLAVTVHEPPPLLAGAPSTNPIAQAFVQAWRNFVALLAALIASLGVLVPALGLAVLGWLAWVRVRRRVAVSAKPAA